MEKIGNIIGTQLNRHNIGRSAIAAEIIHKANRFLSKKISGGPEDARAMSLKDGILYIGTESAARSQEVWGITDPLLRELRKEFGENRVLKIRIKNLTTP